MYFTDERTILIVFQMICDKLNAETKRLLLIKKKIHRNREKKHIQQHNTQINLDR